MKLSSKYFLFCLAILESADQSLTGSFSTLKLKYPIHIRAQYVKPIVNTKLGYEAQNFPSLYFSQKIILHISYLKLVSFIITV